MGDFAFESNDKAFEGDYADMSPEKNKAYNSDVFQRITGQMGKALGPRWQKNLEDAQPSSNVNDLRDFHRPYISPKKGYYNVSGNDELSKAAGVNDIGSRMMPDPVKAAILKSVKRVK